ncbi:hypothetical protein MPLSOD_41071 [Mesorhizobium sp. SOD10]|jgi:hypothetical protein|nr:hypothetical protein MPLSOD_41071 [Mesorhizobium sp. SOD10]
MTMFEKPNGWGKLRQPVSLAPLAQPGLRGKVIPLPGARDAGESGTRLNSVACPTL